MILFSRVIVGFIICECYLFFRYGQLSGMVEPISGLVGALCVSWIESSLPYTMGFAAGAMIYVVFDDPIPEASSWYHIFLFSDLYLRY